MQKKRNSILAHLMGVLGGMFAMGLFASLFLIPMGLLMTGHYIATFLLVTLELTLFSYFSERLEN